MANFTAGTRVIPSAYGLECMPWLKPGIVECRDGEMIFAVVDGWMTYYHESVWAPAPNVGTAAIADAIDDAMHRHATSGLGAQHGENRVRRDRVSPKERAAWSAHLRFLVERSESERRASEPSVGWDPYGDEP